MATLVALLLSFGAAAEICRREHRRIAPPENSGDRRRGSSRRKQTDQWLTYSGSLNGARYSSLAEITPENVSQLKVRWIQYFSCMPLERDRALGVAQ
jgi:glucose dehydrogenase